MTTQHHFGQFDAIYQRHIDALTAVQSPISDASRLALRLALAELAAMDQDLAECSLREAGEQIAQLQQSNEMLRVEVRELHQQIFNLDVNNNDLHRQLHVAQETIDALTIALQASSQADALPTALTDSAGPNQADTQPAQVPAKHRGRPRHHTDGRRTYQRGGRTEQHFFGPEWAADNPLWTELPPSIQPVIHSLQTAQIKWSSVHPSIRLQITAVVLRQLQSRTNQPPSMTYYDINRPSWMPTAGAIIMLHDRRWEGLLTLLGQSPAAQQSSIPAGSQPDQ